MNYLTLPQVEDVLARAYEASARDHLILLLSFRHGLRRSEVAALTLDDVRDGQIHVARVKGSLETCQPLLGHENEVLDEVQALARWRAIRPDGGNSLFNVGDKTVARRAELYLRAAQVPVRLTHHHALKHAFCSIQARKGVKIEYIAQSVGHRDIKNTRIYLNVTDEEAIQEAAKALSGTAGRGDVG